MNSNNETKNGEINKPPFLYEIRVKGRLSAEQWTEWFDDLTVSTGKGESTLRGRVPDHAALYGLIARLRDLAVPLVAAKVLDADAQAKLSQQSRRYDLMLNVLQVVIYLALIGGLASITIFVAPIINTALALALLFALVGGLAHVFGLWSGQARQVWRWVAFAAWLAAAFAFLVYVPVSGVLPPAVGIGLMLILGAGGLMYLLYYLRRRAENIRGNLAQAESVDEGRTPEATHNDDTPAE
jgi:uncharacterized membrane-anchored protein